MLYLPLLPYITLSYLVLSYFFTSTLSLLFVRLFVFISSYLNSPNVTFLCLPLAYPLPLLPYIALPNITFLFYLSLLITFLPPYLSYP